MKIMKVLIIYDSTFGNTEKIARVIAKTLGGFGEVRLSHIDKMNPLDLEGIDILIIGCPIQRHKPTLGIRDFLEQVSKGTLKGFLAATFDTRYRMPRWKSGSAAHVIAKKLRKRGCSLLLSPESFFVAGKEGPLEYKERDRAVNWARMILEKYNITAEGGV